MYERYTGLPDTTKSASSRGTGRENRPGPREGGSYSGGSGGRRGGGSRRKKAMQRRRILVAVSSLVLLGLLALAITVIVKSCNKPVTVDPVVDGFRAGVYINGADVSGKTIEEVRPTLEANEAYAINNIAVTLEGEGFRSTITGADVNAGSNLEQVMTEALSGGANQVYYTKITIDEAALAQKVDEINATLTTPATDASFTVDVSSSGKPEFTYIDGVAGFGIDVAATAKLVQEAFDGGHYQTTINPPLTTVPPAITVEDVKGHTALIGEYTTTYDFKGTAEDTEEQRNVAIPNRAFNVEKAVDAINNQVLKPGYTFSFNKVVGDRTEKNGWKLANGIFGGDRYNYQYGGGVCQVSTTLYNALLKCYPCVEFVERSAHSIPSTYVDKGLDATVDTGHIDFRFKNKSEYPLYVFAYVKTNKKSSSRKRDIVVNIYGEALPAGVSYKPHTELISETPPGEDEITETKKLFIGEEKISAEPRSNFVIDVYIDRYQDGKLQESIFLYTDNYKGNPLKKQVGIMPTPTPIPSATPQVTQAPVTVTPAPGTQDQP